MSTAPWVPPVLVVHKVKDWTVLLTPFEQPNEAAKSTQTLAAQASVSDESLVACRYMP